MQKERGRNPRWLLAGGSWQLLLLLLLPPPGPCGQSGHVLTMKELEMSPGYLKDNLHQIPPIHPEHDLSASCLIPTSSPH